MTSWKWFFKTPNAKLERWDCGFGLPDEIFEMILSFLCVDALLLEASPVNSFWHHKATIMARREFVDRDYSEKTHSFFVTLMRKLGILAKPPKRIDVVREFYKDARPSRMVVHHHDHQEDRAWIHNMAKSVTTLCIEYHVLFGKMISRFQGLFPNVQRIEFSHCLNPKWYYSILLRIPSAHTVIMDGRTCDLYPPNIRHLEIYNICGLTPKFRGTHITKLVLRGIKNNDPNDEEHIIGSALRPKMVRRIGNKTMARTLVHCPNLIHLELYDLVCNHALVRDISASCPKLEVIIMHCPNAILTYHVLHWLNTMPNLRRFKIGTKPALWKRVQKTFPFARITPSGEIIV